MKRSKYNKKILPDDMPEFEEVKEILTMQKYPVEIEEYLNIIAQESERTGWPYLVAEAFNLGVIAGKHKERSKKSIHKVSHKPARDI